MLSSALTSGSSPVQGSLWGRHARDWSEVQESQSRALYEIVLKALALNRDTALLDAGCGSGLFCELATNLGANVMGLDASSALLDLARRRVPHATFFEGEMEELPFVEKTFDVVTTLNSLPYVASPLRALVEARRVLRPGGKLVMAAWARPEQCHVAKYFHALDELLPLASSHTPSAFSFSTDDMMARLATRAGFTKLIEAQALTIWEYPDEETALRGLLSVGAAVRATDCAGEERVRETAQKFLASHRLARGGYRMENAFRYLIAQRS
jgi:ubiquinone/menaquinone biosynthesis C-methylase UbiE